MTFFAVLLILLGFRRHFDGAFGKVNAIQRNFRKTSLDTARIIALSAAGVDKQGILLVWSLRCKRVAQRVGKLLIRAGL